MNKNVEKYLNKYGGLGINKPIFKNGNQILSLGDKIQVKKDNINLKFPEQPEIPKNLYLSIVGFATVNDNKYAIVEYDGGSVWYHVRARPDGKCCQIYELAESVSLETSLYFVHINDIESILITSKQKEGKPMSSKASLVDTFKQDFVDGSYRAAGRKSMDIAHDALCKLLKKQKVESNAVAAFSDLLNHDIGRAVLGWGLGEVVPRLPKVGELKQVDRLTKEWRVDGLAKAETVLFDTVLSTLGPALGAVLENLPKDQSEEVVTTPVPAEVPEELVNAGGKKSANR